MTKHLRHARPLEKSWRHWDKKKAGSTGERQRVSGTGERQRAGSTGTGKTRQGNFSAASAVPDVSVTPGMPAIPGCVVHSSVSAIPDDKRPPSGKIRKRSQ